LTTLDHASVSSERRRDANPPPSPAVSADHVEDEVELRSGLGVVVEIHRAARVSILPGAARDREDGVPGVGERALDRDLAIWQEGRPVALPRLADDDSDAVALIGPDL